MGSPGNICVMEPRENSSVYLYSHYDGDILPITLKEALIRAKSRWTDGPYLTRAIFCEMIRDDNIDDLTGYGISAYLTDTLYEILYVDVDNQTVTIGKDTFTFDEYINKKESFLVSLVSQ